VNLDTPINKDIQRLVGDTYALSCRRVVSTNRGLELSTRRIACPRSPRVRKRQTRREAYRFRLCLTRPPVFLETDCHACAAGLRVLQLFDIRPGARLVRAVCAPCHGSGTDDVYTRTRVGVRVGRVLLCVYKKKKKPVSVSIGIAKIILVFVYSTDLLNVESILISRSNLTGCFLSLF